MDERRCTGVTYLVVGMSSLLVFLDVFSRVMLAPWSPASRAPDLLLPVVVFVSLEDGMEAGGWLALAAALVRDLSSDPLLPVGVSVPGYYLCALAAASVGAGMNIEYPLVPAAFVLLGKLSLWGGTWLLMSTAGLAYRPPVTAGYGGVLVDLGWGLMIYYSLLWWRRRGE